AVRADVTVSMLGRKPGLHTGAGPDHAGEVVLALLELPEEIYDGVAPAAHLLRDTDLSGWLPRRARNSHKGTYGTVLVVGGDHGMMGAALLAARAALRAGAGLVSVATRPEHAAAMTAAQPELMCRGVNSGRELAPLLREASAVVVGPGLGQDTWGRGLLARTLDSSLPLVVDADGLNLLSGEPDRRDGWILTPHPGEAARLLGGMRSADVQDDRLSAVRNLREKYGGVAVLKGAGTLVQGSQLMLCPYGNPGMAGGGMGDVLGGVIAALLAQGLTLETAANAGVLAHALAGDRAAYGGERGMLAEDLLAELRVAVNA
ncbi:MAG TPA: NAD(P)H-hydrate dehydratase, partial [Nevskiaceae bacterium]|nr:NAD(P)H-hydrate dehydratase [Nevskiaceae bacterium]